jgi:hypothetical protein
MISEIIQTVIAPIHAFFGHAERKLTVKIVGSVLKSATPKIKRLVFVFKFKIKERAPSKH